MPSIDAAPAAALHDPYVGRTLFEWATVTPLPGRAGREAQTAIVDAVRAGGRDHEVELGARTATSDGDRPSLALRWASRWARRSSPSKAEMLVATRRLGFSEPLVVARALRTATGRHTRFASIDELATIASALRPLGGVLAHPTEIGSLLRTGEMVAVFCDRVARRPGTVGPVPLHLVAPAHELGLPLLPVPLAVASSKLVVGVVGARSAP